MAEVFKILGQDDPLAEVLTDLYTVPGGTAAVLSTITVANRKMTSTGFRIAIAPNGEADALKHYIYYDVVIPPLDTMVSSIGVTIGAGDVVRVYASNAQLSFGLFGAEVS